MPTIEFLIVACILLALVCFRISVFIFDLLDLLDQRLLDAQEVAQALERERMVAQHADLIRRIRGPANTPGVQS